MVLKITVASNVKGWDIVMNEQLIEALARDKRVEVSGFVPGHTDKQRDQARKLNISLHDAKDYIGFDTNELLAFPPDDLEIDLLIMHSYGRHVGKHAQVIKDAKDCRWVLAVHIFRKNLEKHLEVVASSSQFDISEHELQVNLCMRADLVLAIGPQTAEDYKGELRLGRDKVFALMPSIPIEFSSVQRRDRNVPFQVLLSASDKYFEVKGCFIAAEAFKELKDLPIHLKLVVKVGDNTATLKAKMVKAGISQDQLTVQTFSGGDKAWQELLDEVDLLIKPSISEGFGMSGLRAIAAELPVLISGNCGLAIALKELPSGYKHVVDEQDPQVWAKRIKEIKEKDVETCRSEAEQLKNQYSAAYNLEDQVNSLIDKFSTMVRSDRQHGVE